MAGSAEAGALLGAPAPDGAWLFPQGGWARPASVCAAMLAACGDTAGARVSAPAASAHRARDGAVARAGRRAASLIAQAPVVVLANGAGATALAQAAHAAAGGVRGQVTHLDAGAVPTLPFVLCREAYLTPGRRAASHSAGATYD